MMKFTYSKRHILFFILLLSTFIFLRFFDIPHFTIFNFDQVNHAWTAKNMIVDHIFPLVGPVAKLNSGITIGPLYYYYNSFFYFLYHLDPFAAGVSAGFASVFTFFCILYVTKKLFSFNTALIAVALYTVSYYCLSFDRIAWNVEFFPGLSLLFFYSLYQIVTGKEKFLFLVAVVMGFAFHAHFTAIFFPIFLFASLPFFPRTKKVLKYGILAIPIFLLFLLPNAIAIFFTKNHTISSGISYSQTYSHGFHLRRFFQIVSDAFIELEQLLFFTFLKPIEFALPFLFAIIYLWKKATRERKLFVYLFCLWIIVPWIVFTIYSGELSDYYFIVNRPIFLMMIAYLLCIIFFNRTILFQILGFVVIVIYAYYNISHFFVYANGLQSVAYHEKYVKELIKNGQSIQFTQGDANSYLYYVYTKK